MSQDYELVEANAHTTRELAEKWAASEKDIASWCKSGLIGGATKQSTFPWRWLIPFDAKRPLDSRVIRELLWQILELQNNRIVELDITCWGIPLSDIPACVQALVDAGYLRELKNSQQIRLSNKAFSVLGRKIGGRIDSDSLEPLVLKAAVAGSFVGAVIKQLM